MHGLNSPSIEKIQQYQPDIVRVGGRWSVTNYVVRHTEIPYVFVPSSLYRGGWWHTIRTTGVSDWNIGKMEQVIRQSCQRVKKERRSPYAVCGINEPDHRVYFPQEKDEDFRQHAMVAARDVVRSEFPDLPFVGPDLSSSNPAKVAHYTAVVEPDIVGVHLLRWTTPWANQRRVLKIRSLTGINRIAATEHNRFATRRALEASGCEFACRNR